MRVVQIVGRANRNVIDLLAAPAQLVDMAIEPFELDEETRVRKIAVDNADGIVRIEGDLQIAADRLDGLHVPRRDVSGRANESKRCHCKLLVLFEPATLPHSG